MLASVAVGLCKLGVAIKCPLTDYSKRLKNLWIAIELSL